MAFATFVPRASRAVVIRAMTAYQVAFDYIDTISEQPGADPIANGRQLNQALMVALEPDAAHPDYYAHHNRCEDTGYLCDLVDTCRTALYGCFPPTRAIASPSTHHNAHRHLPEPQPRRCQGSYDAFTRWARARNPQGTGLSWWEMGAAAGSPLPVFALIATAAKPATRRRDAVASRAPTTPGSPR